jgi:LCP family protein required for cell wall assembly
MNHRRERRVAKRRRSVAITLAAATALVFAGAGWFWLSNAHIPSASAKTAVTVQKVADAHFTPSSNAPIFFLIIGNDERPGVGGARGDALHVLGYNPASKQGAILNIPRDTTVPIPGNGTNKINAANAFGGPKLQAETIGKMMGLSIPYVISTNFEGYVGLINDLGGVEVDVPTRMYDSDAGSHFEPGRQKLSGDDALAFARDRHSFANGDFTRTANQALVALGALRKIKAEANEPVGAFKALAAVSRRTKLEGLGLRELYDLMRIAMQADPAQIKSIVVPVAMGSYQPKPEAQQLFADFRDDGVVQSQ